jgi:hypothetical protein
MKPVQFGMTRLRAGLLALAVVLAGVGQAKAEVIASFTASAGQGPSGFYAQVLTTPNGGAWDHLTFNYFSDSPATTPAAAGHVFLLTQSYTGTPAALSSGTPGFVAESMFASGGVWTFAPDVPINSNTEYFFYADSSLVPSVAASVVPGTGGIFLSMSSGSDFSFDFNTLAFLLQGDPLASTPVTSTIPEPSTLSLLAAGLGLAAWWRRRRAAATA